MIGRVSGRVAHRDAGAVVVDVQGVGYLVQVPTGERVPARGEPVELWTSLQVREDALTLYGFTERSSMALFELLLTSSGVGPRLALAALGTHRPDVLRAAIAGGDVATLTQVPGIGRKVAERLILELRDKVGADAGAGPPGAPPAVPDEPASVHETRQALAALGYTAAEIQGALGALEVDGDATTPALVRAALRSLGSGAQAREGRRA